MSDAVSLPPLRSGIKGIARGRRAKAMLRPRDIRFAGEVAP